VVVFVVVWVVELSLVTCLFLRSLLLSSSPSPSLLELCVYQRVMFSTYSFKVDLLATYSASEMTYIAFGGALNSTYLLTFNILLKERFSPFLLKVPVKSQSTNSYRMC